MSIEKNKKLTNAITRLKELKPFDTPQDVLDDIKMLIDSIESAPTTSDEDMVTQQAGAQEAAAEIAADADVTKEQVDELKDQLKDSDEYPEWIEKLQYNSDRIDYFLKENRRLIENKEGLIEWDDLTLFLFSHNQRYREGDQRFVDLDHAKRHYDFLQNDWVVYKMSKWELYQYGNYFEIKAISEDKRSVEYYKIDWVSWIVKTWSIW